MLWRMCCGAAAEKPSEIKAVAVLRLGRGKGKGPLTRFGHSIETTACLLRWTLSARMLRSGVAKAVRASFLRHPGLAQADMRGAFA